MRVFDVMIETTREIVQVESKLFPFSQDKFLSTVSGAEPPIVAARQQILSLISDNMATPAKATYSSTQPLPASGALKNSAFCFRRLNPINAHSSSTGRAAPRRACGALVRLCRGRGAWGVGRGAWGVPQSAANEWLTVSIRTRMLR